MFEQQTTLVPGVVIGRVTGVDERGLPVVSTAAGEATADFVAWMPEPPRWSACIGLRVAVSLVEGEAGGLLVLALLDAPPQEVARAPTSTRVEGDQELVMECGKARITLRADGRVETRGTHVISRSSGPNKVKGSSVHIN